MACKPAVEESIMENSLSVMLPKSERFS